MTGDSPSGLVLSPTAQVGEGVRFGAHVVVHDDVVIGDGVVVQDGAILGKPPTLSPRSAMAGAAGAGGIPSLVIEEGAAICAQAIVIAGARIGRGTIVGDQSVVRERSVIGEGCVIGRGATVDCDVTIGDRVRLQTQVYITAFSVIEDDVFVGPCAMTTNDDTMARRAPHEPMRGATLRRACRIGGGAVLVPGVEVGEEAFVAAGAVVTNDVPARALVMGVPARVVRQVPEDQLLERWS
jgi:acetyltransferase-like isoleucine patch superfamily enzyme